MTYIATLAARGQRSRFNLAAPLLRAMYSLMAIGAVIITLAAGWTGLR